MARFVFELQKVLEFREFEKERAEGELAKALAVETELNEKLAELAQQYNALKNQMKGSLDFADVVSQSRFNSLLDFQREELLRQLSEARLVSEQRREVLRECMKKTTALEKLREQKLAEFRAAEDYAEAEFMDDLVTMKFIER